MAGVWAMAAGDIDAVLKLESATPQAPHWDRAVYERIVAPGTGNPASRAAWVAVNGLDLLGFAVAHLVSEEVCELESIVVAKSARRKGTGRVLLSAVSGWAVGSEAQKLELEVRAGNASAIAFYESAGFLREGVRLGYYRDPEEDAVLMGRLLYSDD